MLSRPRTLTLATAVVAEMATVLVAMVPGLRFAYQLPALHVAIETAAALTAMLAAYLVFGRYRITNRLDELYIGAALFLLACSNLFFAVFPATASRGTPPAMWSWAAAFGQLAGSVVFALGAFAPHAKVRRPWTVAAVAVVACLGLLGVDAALAYGLAPLLPDSVATPAAVRASAVPQLGADPTILAVQIAAMLGFGVACVGLTRRAEQTGDDLIRWFAVGATLATFSRLNYFLYPSLYSDWVYTGDVFRLLFYVVLALGAAREIDRYWRREAEAAVLEERRRIARELHDGLAQDLAYVSRRSRELVPDAPGAAQIAAAADRALVESRRAIAALTRPLDEPLEVVLAQTVEEAAARAHARLVLELEPGIRLATRVREALLRIAGEAVANAAKHANAQVVRVQLSSGDRVRLRIADDGVGFDPRAVEGLEGERFGLVSMRERAAALGADFRLRSQPGAGTVVLVTLP